MTDTAPTDTPKRRVGRPSGKGTYVMPDEHKAKISRSQLRTWAIRKYQAEQNERSG